MAEQIGFRVPGSGFREQRQCSVSHAPKVGIQDPGSGIRCSEPYRIPDPGSRIPTFDFPRRSGTRNPEPGTRLFAALALCLLAASFAAAAAEPSDAIKDAEINAITYDDAVDDTAVVIPVAASLEHLDDDRKKAFDEWTSKVESWALLREASVAQRVRNAIALASILDIVQSEWEGENAYYIFEKLKADIPQGDLIKACAWINLRPNEGTVPTAVTELGIESGAVEEEIRGRSTMYAKKLLGRLLGKLPPKP